VAGRRVVGRRFSDGYHSVVAAAAVVRVRRRAVAAAAGRGSGRRVRQTRRPEEPAKTPPEQKWRASETQEAAKASGRGVVRRQLLRGKQ